MGPWALGLCLLWGDTGSGLLGILHTVPLLEVWFRFYLGIHLETICVFLPFFLLRDDTTRVFFASCDKTLYASFFCCTLCVCVSLARSRSSFRSFRSK